MFLPEGGSPLGADGGSLPHAGSHQAVKSAICALRHLPAINYLQNMLNVTLREDVDLACLQTGNLVRPWPLKCKELVRSRFLRLSSLPQANRFALTQDG